MFTKTSAIAQNSYFKSVLGFSPKSYRQTAINLTSSQADSVYLYDKPVYLTAKSGISMLLVSNQLAGPYDKFMLHGSVKIQPQTFFNIISVSDESQISLAQATTGKFTEHQLEETISWKPIERQVDVSEIYTLFYQVKKTPYQSETEQHNFCELTVVEQGELETTVDGVTYKLSKHDAILYQHNQPHNQAVNVEETTTYITVLFDMNLLDPQFFNRVFHLGASQVSQLENLVRISEMEDYPYKNDQLLARLKLLILSFISDSKPAMVRSSAMKEKYDQEICQKITEYIKEHPEARVIDVSKAFGISRSNIQSLFHRFVHMQPRAYIEAQRMKQAKILMRESSYSLTEIAKMVGYHSLPAFSRSFKHVFGYPPSRYAQQLYKLA